MNRGKAARAIQERSTAPPPADHANVGSGRSPYKAASTGRSGAPLGDGGTVGGRSGDRYVLSSGKPCFRAWRSWGTNSVDSWEHLGAACSSSASEATISLGSLALALQRAYFKWAALFFGLRKACRTPDELEKHSETICSGTICASCSCATVIDMRRPSVRREQAAPCHCITGRMSASIDRLIGREF